MGKNRWDIAMEELDGELRKVVASADALGNFAMRQCSWALYHRLIWQEDTRDAEVVKKVLSFVLTNPDVARSIWAEWLANYHAIAKAGEDLHISIRDATRKFLEAVQQNRLTL